MGRETGGRPVRQFVFGIATRTAVRPVAAWKAKSLAFHSLREMLLRCHALGRSQTILLGRPRLFPHGLGLRLSRAPHHAGLFRAFTSLRRTTPPGEVTAALPKPGSGSGSRKGDGRDDTGGGRGGDKFIWGMVPS